MLLKEYLTKYRIPRSEFAVRCKIGVSTLFHYLAGTRKPNQTTAERIEKESDGLVTVFEQRGTDKRKK